MTTDEDFDVLHYLAVCAPSVEEWLQAAFDAWDGSNGGDRYIETDDRGRKVFWFKVGKSGLNNKIIEAMAENDFMWNLCWYSTKRWGKVKFRTRAIKEPESCVCCSPDNLVDFQKPVYFGKVTQ